MTTMSAGTSWFPVNAARYDDSFRGFMLDVSRDRVPTRSTLDFLTRVMARCGLNHLELYGEAGFAYRGEEEVWADRSPVTAEDMRWLDGLCRGRGIELGANQNCLGHMEPWLETESHHHRCENPDGVDLPWGVHARASTLAPVPENLDFVQRLLGELTETVSSKFLNVGLDEPWELGTGVSADRCRDEGKGVVYAKWARDVVTPWLDRGWRVAMWADIVNSHPEALDIIPDEVLLIPWTYESPAMEAKFAGTEGYEIRSDAGFASTARLVANAGRPFVNAPGTGAWNTFTGRLSNAVGNIVDAVITDHSLGGKGVLLTGWGDSGHHAGLVFSLVPLVVTGVAIADPDHAEGLNSAKSLVNAVSQALLDVDDHPGAHLLVGAGLLEDKLGVIRRNHSLPARCLLEGDPGDDLGADGIAATRAEIARLHDRANETEAALGGGPIGWVEDVRIGLDLVCHSLDVLTGGELTVSPALLDRFATAWLRTSRPRGLARSMARLPGGADYEEVAAKPVSGLEHWRGLLGL